MPRRPQLTRAEKKAALMSRVEALVEQLLDWAEATPQPRADSALTYGKYIVH